MFDVILMYVPTSRCGNNLRSLDESMLSVQSDSQCLGLPILLQAWKSNWKLYVLLRTNADFVLPLV